MTQEMRIGFLITNYAKLRGMTKQQLAKKLGICDTTLSARYKRPGGWKLEELVKAFEILDVPKEERWV